MEPNGTKSKTTATTTTEKKESQNCTNSWNATNRVHCTRLSAVWIFAIQQQMKQHHREKSRKCSSRLAFFVQYVSRLLCNGALMISYAAFFSLILRHCARSLWHSISTHLSRLCMCLCAMPVLGRMNKSAWYNLCTQCVHLNAHHLLSDLGYYPIYTDSRMYDGNVCIYL